MRFPTKYIGIIFVMSRALLNSSSANEQETATKDECIGAL